MTDKAKGASAKIIAGRMFGVVMKAKPAKPAKSTKSAKLPNPWRLLKDSVGLYAKHWRQLALIAGVIAVPVNLLTLVTAGDLALSSYMSLATLFMNLALIWTVIELEAERPAGLSRAYYDGTAQVVSFLVVAVVLTLQLIPFLLGATIYVNANTSGSGGLTPAEQLLVGLVWFILALPTIYWLLGSIFAVFSVQDSAVRPLEAVRQSRKLAKGHRLAIAGRLALLGVAFLLVLAVPSLVLAALPASSWVRAAQVGIQILSSLTLLPISIIYAFKLYRSL